MTIFRWLYAILHFVIFSITALFLNSAVAAPGDIVTLAGGGIGDNGQATSASFYYPVGVAVDGSGNTYIADIYNNRIRKVDTAGVVTTIAGNGTAGYSGDNGLATSAQLYNPNGVSVDTAGNIYIADSSNCRIRKVDTSGVITTVAGDGTFGYSGDNGQATSAKLYYPTGLTLDALGNIFIADSNNNRVRKVATNGVITTVAGNGTIGYAGDNGQATAASLNTPFGLAVDTTGNIYIADLGNNRIRKVDTYGVITTFAGNGTASYSGDNGLATSASLNSPRGIARDASGNIYIADEYNNRIRKVSTNRVITTVAGTGTAGYSGDNGLALSAKIYSPLGVAIDASGNMYIADFNNIRIRKVNSSGIITTLAGNGNWQGGFSGDGSQAATASLNYPYGVFKNALGNTYIADTFNNRVRKVDANGVITTVAGNGDAEYLGDNGQAILASLNNPYSAIADEVGNVYIADTGNNRIRKVDVTGVITTIAGNGVAGSSGDNGQAVLASLNSPRGLAADALNNIYITSGNQVRKVDTSGVITTIAGNGAFGYSGDNVQATSASLSHPAGIALDSFGNIYIADQYNHRIRKVDVSGIITTVAGNGVGGYAGDNGQALLAKLYFPFGVTVDASGNIYMVDTANKRIRKVDTSGVIATIAGNGSAGDAGDNGPATSATFNSPQGLSVDPQGNIFIADTSNQKVRKVIETIKPSGTISINDGAVYTKSATVTLSLTCSDTDGTCHKVQFSDDGIMFSALGSYATTTAWTLPSSDGTKTVYARFSDIAGNISEVANSSIILDTTPPTTTVSPSGGAYGFVQSVTLACEDNNGSGCANIYYCTGISCTPTTLYTGAISINSSTDLRFYSVDNAGNSEAVKTASYTISAVPSPPANITLSNMKTSGPKITWTAVSDALTYSIYRSPDNATWTLIGSVNHPASTYNDTSAPAANTIFYWTVTASNSNGESSIPSGVSGRTALRPGWNMISAPVNTGTLLPQAVYGSWANWAWTWASTGNIDPDNNGSFLQNQPVKPAHGQYLWVYNDSTVLTASGSPNPASVTITLKPGWNIIGNHTAYALTGIDSNWLIDYSMPLSTAITSNIIGGGIYFFNGSTFDSWSVLLDNPVVEPWKGYWILNMESVDHALTLQ